MTLTDWLYFIWSDRNRRTIAIKRVLARQLAEEMKLKKIAKTEMASRMQTSRSQLDRLLDPEKNQGFRLIRSNGPHRWWVVNCKLNCFEGWIEGILEGGDRLFSRS